MLAIYAKYVALPTKSVSSIAAIKRLYESSRQRFNGKDEKTSVSKAHWYTESKKELAGNLFC